MNKRLLLLMAWTLGGAGLTGCVDLRPKGDPSRIFVLTTLPEPAAGEGNGMPPGVTVGIRAVRLPAYLQQDRVAVRRGENEIVYSDYDRWAEPLERGLMRTFAANLRAVPGAGRVFEGPVSKGTVDLELELQVDEFVVDTSGLATVQVRCQFWPAPETPMMPIRLQAQGPAPATDMPGSIAALSSLLGEVSRQVAGRLVSGGR